MLPGEYAILFTVSDPRIRRLGVGGGSSKGRTADFGSANLGSNPSPPAMFSEPAEHTPAHAAMSIPRQSNIYQVTPQHMLGVAFVAVGSCEATAFCWA